MVSELGWIDISPIHRKRINNFMDLMGMGGVVDELGIGVIRDAISNKIFPGFSTLYTRAKYFFITPDILCEKDKKKGARQTPRQYFENVEIDINKRVYNFYKDNPDRGNESFFGKEKGDGILKRQPSEIYWNGIIKLKLVNSESSLEQLLEDKPSTIEELLSNNRGDDVSMETGENHNNRICDISYDADWRDVIEEQGLTLTEVEANTLIDRLQKHLPDSLPAALVSNPDLWNLYNSDNVDFVNFIDEAFNQNLISNQMLRKNLALAHDFALFIYGSHIAYNIRLWQRWKEKGYGDNDAYISELRKKGGEWFSSVKNNLLTENFHIDMCMENVKVNATKCFLQNVQELISNNNDWPTIEDELCNLSEKQERWNKKTKSRFLKIEKNQVIEEMQNKTAWLGLGLIQYRYAAARSVINDIYNSFNYQSQQ